MLEKKLEREKFNVLQKIFGEKVNSNEKITMKYYFQNLSKKFT